MKIATITGSAFINTVPAALGEVLKPYDMLDVRQGAVTFEDGTEIAGMCTRLVDLGLADINSVVEQVTDAVTSQEVFPGLAPVVEPVQPTVEVTEEAAEVTKK